MPGWWFTIESTTTKHFINQFKTAVEDALRSKPAVRAIMRARATKQRFPVSQWVEDLEKLQSSALDISHKQAAKERRPTLDSPSTPAILETPGLMSVLQSRLAKPALRPRPAVAQPQKEVGGLSPVVEDRLLSGPSPGLGSKLGPGATRKGPLPPILLNVSSANPKAANVLGTDRSTVKPNESRRLQTTRAPAIPGSIPEDDEDTFRLPETLKTEPSISEPVPSMRMSDRKAMKLLGMQVPASRLSTIAPSQEPPDLIDDILSEPSSAGYSPFTPTTPYTPNTPLIAGSNELIAVPEPISPPIDPLPRALKRSSVLSAISSAATSIGHATARSSVSLASSATSINTAPSIRPPGTKAVNSTTAEDKFPSWGGHYFPHGSIAVLSTDEVQDEKPDNKLQNVTPFFSDTEKKYETVFKQKLKKLNGKTSEDQLCIEEYLLKSEKAWFGKLRDAEMANPDRPTAAEQPSEAKPKDTAKDDGFGLPTNHKPPTGMKLIMRKKFGDWPVYSFLLAFVSNLEPVDGRHLLTRRMYRAK